MHRISYAYLLTAAIAVATVYRSAAQEPASQTAMHDNTTATIDKGKVKRGWNFGPLPAVGYNSDLGFQFGALCDIFYYGNGDTFPEYLHKFNVEASWYTKGSGVFHLFYDSKHLIPGTRFTFAATYMPNKMMSFYGFNGYASPYSARTAAANASYYAIDRNLLRILADFQGRITDRIGWAAGVSFWDYRIGAVRLEKYEGRPSLYREYVDHGVIRQQEAKGGALAEFKLGIVYDTRNHEPAPDHGIWAELIAYGSPDIFNRTGNSYLKISASFRHYISLIRNRLVLAYRIAYQGTVAGRPPFYVQQAITTLYLRQVNSEGLGSINTLRGLLYNRIVGDGYAWANVELRLRLFDFRLFGQEWYLGINPFFDAGCITQSYRLAEMKASGSAAIYSGEADGLHMSAGIGVKAVMNRNFIVSVEWGKPFDRRDGPCGMNIGLNYIF